MSQDYPIPIVVQVGQLVRCNLPDLDRTKDFLEEVLIHFMMSQNWASRVSHSLDVDELNRRLKRAVKRSIKHTDPKFVEYLDIDIVWSQDEEALPIVNLAFDVDTIAKLDQQVNQPIPTNHFPLLH
jgi:hypothetical protein